MDINDKSASDYDIKIVPNLLDELLASMQVNESTSPEIVQSIHALQDEIAVATKTIGSEHPHVLQLLRDLVEKYIDINHYSHAERLLRRLEKAYIRTYGTSHIQYIYQSIRLGELFNLFLPVTLPTISLSQRTPFSGKFVMMKPKRCIFVDCSSFLNTTT